MTPVKATYVCNEVEPGWPIMDDAVPLGREYTIDLDRVEKLTMYNRDLKRTIEVDCVFVLGPSGTGWLPLIAFKVAES